MLDCFVFILFFIYCAVGYFGFFVVEESRKELKCYGVFFICMVSRVIYFEFVNFFEIDFFINVLRRFISRCGLIC